MVKKIVVLHQGVTDSKDPMELQSLSIRDNLSEAIDELGYKSEPIFLDDRFEWISKIIDMKPDMVFNAADIGLFHNILYEPNIAAVLDGTDIPYTGSGYYSLGFSGDKFASKKISQIFQSASPKMLDDQS
ncbi:MAG: hypothetical protein V1870_02510 [Candidatus Aenigmatarchaeota archaeon]